jgi:ABC-type phosphate transport system auxiliary subunit
MQEIVKDTTRTSLVRDTSLRLAINEFDEVLQGFTTVDEANNLVADLSALKRLNEETREKINALHQKLKKRHSIIRDESE